MPAEETVAAGTTDAAGGLVTPDPSTASDQPGASAPADYKQRISTSPEFAVEEVTKHQSRADRAEAANRELLKVLGGDQSQLLSMAKQYGSDAVLDAINRYARYTSDPKLGKVIEAFEKGGNVTTQEYEDEEYLSDEQREIRELRAQLDATRGEISELTVNSGGAALQGHLENVFESLLLEPGEIETVKGVFESQVRDWSKTDAGKSVLRSLQKATARNDVRALVLKALPEETIFKLGERRRLREQRELGGFETDSPSYAGEQDGGDLPEAKTALEALRAAKANPGALARRYGRG